MGRAPDEGPHRVKPLETLQHIPCSTGVACLLPATMCAGSVVAGGAGHMPGSGRGATRTDSDELAGKWMNGFASKTKLAAAACSCINNTAVATPAEDQRSDEANQQQPFGCSGLILDLQAYWACVHCIGWRLLRTALLFSALLGMLTPFTTASPGHKEQLDQSSARYGTAGQT